MIEVLNDKGLPEIGAPLGNDILESSSVNQPLQFGGTSNPMGYMYYYEVIRRYRRFLFNYGFIILCKP